MTDAARILEPFVEGWAGYQRHAPRSDRTAVRRRALVRTAPFQWAVWQLAGHMAGSRAYWFHDILGEGDEEVGHMFAVESMTVPTCRSKTRGGRTTNAIPARRAS